MWSHIPFTAETAELAEKLKGILSILRAQRRDG
jgi:hypothetical protein